MSDRSGRNNEDRLVYKNAEDEVNVPSQRADEVTPEFREPGHRDAPLGHHGDQGDLDHGPLGERPADRRDGLNDGLGGLRTGDGNDDLPCRDASPATTGRADESPLTGRTGERHDVLGEDSSAVVGGPDHASGHASGQVPDHVPGQAPPDPAYQVDPSHQADPLDPLDPANPVPTADAHTGQSGPARSAPAPATQGAPLFDQDSEEVRRRWQEVQASFVDDPRDSVERADSLVTEITDSLRAALEARTSELQGRWKSGDRHDTEDLRTALRDYRALLEQLLNLSTGKR